MIHLNSRANRFPATSPKATGSGASTYFPITVLYEDKSSKPTSYEFVLKATSTVGDVSCFVFSFA